MRVFVWLDKKDERIKLKKILYRQQYDEYQRLREVRTGSRCSREVINGAEWRLQRLEFGW